MDNIAAALQTAIVELFNESKELHQAGLIYASELKWDAARWVRNLADKLEKVSEVQALELFQDTYMEWRYSSSQIEQWAAWGIEKALATTEAQQ